MWKWSLSLHHRKKLNIHASAADLLHTILEQEISNSADAKSSQCRCFAKKGFLWNFAKFTGHSCAWGNTCEFCKIFKIFFTEQLLTTASKSGYCNNEARYIDCICCRELDTMLIASAKIPEGEGRISRSSFYEHLPDC